MRVVAGDKMAALPLLLLHTRKTRAVLDIRGEIRRLQVFSKSQTSSLVYISPRLQVLSNSQTSGLVQVPDFRFCPSPRFEVLSKSQISDFVLVPDFRFGPTPNFRFCSSPRLLQVFPKSIQSNQAGVSENRFQETSLSRQPRLFNA